MNAIIGNDSRPNRTSVSVSSSSCSTPRSNRLRSRRSNPRIRSWAITSPISEYARSFRNATSCHSGSPGTSRLCSSASMRSSTSIGSSSHIFSYASISRTTSYMYRRLHFSRSSLSSMSMRAQLSQSHSDSSPTSAYPRTPSRFDEHPPASRSAVAISPTAGSSSS